MADFIEFNNDQRRESINTAQRFQAWREAAEREHGYRGSMVWDETAGRRYLLRSYYDEKGLRRQRSLGPESPETIALKQRFDEGRLDAVSTRKKLDVVIGRQAAINRALGLGRVPLLTARILRLLDRRGLLGRGLRVVGTNALYAYEAACGVILDASVTTTEDVDLLFNSRRRLRLVGDPDLPDDTLFQLLKRADRSFTMARQSFRARNDEGFLVDLIKPMSNPPWAKGAMKLSEGQDLEAAEIEGLVWMENAPSFQQVVIDERGFPLRMIAADPRVFAIHKLWVSSRAERDAVKRVRDRAQSLLVAKLAKTHMQHLPFEPSELRMMPETVVSDALTEFERADA